MGSTHIEQLEHKGSKPGDSAVASPGKMGIGDGTTFTAEENRQVLRRIDCILMPMLFVTYTLNFLDKQALSFSVNFGLKEDNNLTGNQYSWASGSIFYLAYMVSQPLISRALQWFPIHRFVAVMVILWGIILMVTAASRSFASLMVIRWFLGSVESCINPAFVIITSQWYTRQEQPARISYWYLGNALGQFLGGLLGYGIGHIPGVGGLGNWIWYFIIFGAITLVHGVVLLVLLPEKTSNAIWLNERQREVATARMLQNHTGSVNRQWKWNQFFEALTDPQTFVLFIVAILNTIPAGGIASFGSIVIKGFGYSALNTTLLNMPLGAIQAVSLLSGGWIASKVLNTRTWIMGLSQVPAIIGAVLLYRLPSENKSGRLVSYYIIQTHSVSFTMTMAMLTANFAGFTKKATASALVFMGWCAGQIIAPQLFIESEAPRYSSAFVAQFSCFSLLTVLPFVLQGYLRWQNWRRDRAYGNSEESHGEESLDRTDREQKTFRYVY